MHSFDGKTATFHFNSDLSGEVIINTEGEKHITVAGEDLLNFIAEWVRLELQTELENLTARQVLGLKD